MHAINLGKAAIRPRAPLTAGEFAMLTYTYTAGHPIDDSGYVKIALRNAGDFGIPQFTDPNAPNYCTVNTNGNCRIMPRWDPKGNTRPWGQAIYLKITGGFLDKDEKIILVFGNRCKGSPGWQVQTFCEHTFEFKTYVDPFATYEFKALPLSPEIRITAGKPYKAVCIAPSHVAAGKEFTYRLKIEDKWGNPVKKPKQYKHHGFSRPRIEVIKAIDPLTGFTAYSNPIDVKEKSSPLQYFWADFHGQSEETIGSNSIQDYFTFARDYALLDICCHQGNDFQITDDFWINMNETTREFYKPDSFVTFAGYEWSGNTPLGGDRNVYFKDEGGKISRSSCELIPGKTSMYKDSPTAAELFDNLKNDKNPASFVFAHAGGRYADLSMHDPELEVGVEVHSAWGTFEWLVEDALKRGYRIGICANSDGHKTRPGASYPGARKFGSYGGLTCVLAERLDRENVFNAIKARHFYATTGNRPILEVTVTVEGRHAMMGDVLRISKGTPVLKVRAAGTSPIERIEIRNRTELLHTMHPYSRNDLGKRIKIVWSGAEVKGRARMCCWDGSLSVKNNRIISYTPVNFWNPEQQPERVSTNRVKWKSFTTGGTAGLILDLKSKEAGSIEIDTVQRKTTLNVKSIDLIPKTINCGGLRKQIQVYRLADNKDSAYSFEFEMPLKKIHKGDNPVYVCLYQEDGHMAWTSPIYIIAEKG